jgi:uncharacterized phiE125 gp8 family phage protein
MRWEIKLDTDATVEPVSVTEAKSHLRVTGTDDDTYIGTVIKAARYQVENMINRALVTQTWTMHLTDWPGGDEIRLPRAPLQSVTHVKYTDSDNTLNTTSTDVYGVDINSTPGRIYLKPSQTWPSGALYEGLPIVITYEAGYGDAEEAEETGIVTSSVPPGIVHAIKLMISDLYEHRETVVIGQQINVSNTIEALLSPYKVRSVYP